MVTCYHDLLFVTDVLKFTSPFKNEKIAHLIIRFLTPHAAGNDFMQVWTNLCYRECFCKTNCWQELHFEFSRQKFEQEYAKPFYVVMTHHTAKANLEKGSFWPPEAIPYGEWHIRGLVLTCPINPTP